MFYDFNAYVLNKSINVFTLLKAVMYNALYK